MLFVMSPTKRPDAIKRTPSSDSVNNYYRTLAALRSSEGSKPVGGSRAAFSILPSPPIVSPLTQLTDRKTRNAEWRKQGSQHYNMPPTPLRGPVASLVEPSYFPPVTVLDESSPLWIKDPVRSSDSDGVGTLQTFNDKRTSKTSDTSSLATRGSKRHVSRASEASSAVTPDSVRDETDVRLEAWKKTRQWKHIISRPWFEGQIGRASISSKESEDDESKAPIVQLSNSQDSLEVSHVNKGFEDPIPASRAVISLINARKKSDDASAITLKTNSSAETPISRTIEGLYRRTKQILGFKAGPFARSRDEQDMPDTATTEGTGATLNRVTSQLRAFGAKGHKAKNARPTSSSVASNSPHPGSLKAEGSVSSVTPSVRREKDLRILGLSRRTSDEGFLRIKQITIDADEAETLEQFVARLPEHLPSSPMCPRHPKNKLKGKGVCVYHGRNAA